MNIFNEKHKFSPPPVEFTDIGCQTAQPQGMGGGVRQPVIHQT